jgi:hypothetical protein
MKNKFYTIILVLVCFSLVACFGSGNKVIDGADIDINEPTYEDDGTTSITVIGNPEYDISTDAQVYLTLNQEKNNLKFLKSDGLSDVLSFADPDYAEKALSDETVEVPGVKSFILGPNGEIAMKLFAGIMIDDVECLLLYAQDNVETCVQAAPYDVIDSAQFDEAGNVYYYGLDTSDDVKSLTKWDVATQEKTQITNQNIELNDWLTHATGTVYLSGTIDKVPFFRVYNNGSMSDLLSGDAVVNTFNFIDVDHMIIHAENVTYNSEVVTGNFLFRLTNNAIEQMLDFGGGDLEALQLDNGDNVYVLEEGIIHKIYPGVVQQVEWNLDKITLFKIYNDTFYMSCQQEGISKFVKATQGSAGAEITTLLEQTELYHLETDGSHLYYDALDLATNAYYVGIYDLANNTETRVENISNGLVQLESIYSVNNLTFSQIDFDDNALYALTRVGTTSESNTIKSPILLEVDESVALEEEPINREKVLLADKLRFYVEAGSLKAVKQRFNTVYTLINASAVNSVDTVTVEKVTLVSGANRIIGVVGTHKVYNNKVLNLYSFIKDNTNTTVTLTFINSADLDSGEQSIKAVQATGDIFVVNQEGVLKKFDSALHLRQTKRVFYGQGDVSIVNRAGNLLFLRAMNTTTLRPKLLVIDATTLNHIQTNTLRPRKAILNVFMYDVGTTVVKVQSLVSGSLEFYVLE